MINADDTMVRKPAVAGRFYDGDEIKLRNHLKQVFDKAKELLLSKSIDIKPSDILGLISPHAGYVFSGTVAATAYRPLLNSPARKTVFVLGSSHYTRLNGAAVYNGDFFETPMGKVKVNKEIVQNLLGSEYIIAEDYAHQKEHSLEVQLPFLQYMWGDDFSIVPLIIATEDTKACNEIAGRIAPYLTPGNLLVVSTDLSHFPNYNDAYLIDKLTVDAMCTGDKNQLMAQLQENEEMNILDLSTSMCGWTSVYTAMSAFEKVEHRKIIPVLYQNSGDAPKFGDKERVVGYQSALVVSELTMEFILSKTDKEALIDLAKESLARYLKTGKEIVHRDGLSDPVKMQTGAFVSVYVNDELRGCIGSMKGNKSLDTLVQELVISAATQDSRFEAVSLEELDDLKVEISVLTPMKQIHDIEEFELGKHGIYMTKGGISGTFLPQVA
ncbi:MAG: AmmeMemoRadiSam system protein B, partial [Bacteroidales bacterium]|nr:AmmeMemoRadiSam system protein B [Bacteroidales bacterium]